MKLLSIQVGLPQEMRFRGRKIMSAIQKRPIPGPVMVHTLKLEGDGQADLRLHGGIDKAVYAYGRNAYTWWEKQRPQDAFAFGAFGENLTFDDLAEDQIFIGDVFKIGDAILQAVQPRQPCFKLGVLFNDETIITDFLEADRPGVYFKVLKEGLIDRDQELELIRQDNERISILRLYEIILGAETDYDEIATLSTLEALPAKMRNRFRASLEES